jgi:transcription initiation factor TFIIIB Brf1 subunit/transcription initiation factor TFIIB
MMHGITCEECGGALVFSKNGEYVCEDCGLVYEGAKIALPSFSRVNDRRRAQHFEVLNRTPFKVPILWRNIGNNDGSEKARVMERFSRLNFVQRYYIDKLSIRAIRRAYAVLLSLCSLLPTQLSLTVRRRALEMYYSAALKLRSTRKNHMALMTASFYIAIRERYRKCELTLKQIITHLRKMNVNISFSDVFKAIFLLRKAIGVTLRPRSPEELLSVAIRKVIYDERVKKRLLKNNIDSFMYSKELYVETSTLLKKVKCNKSPLSLVATAIYTADKILVLKHRWKDVLTQKSLSSILNVSPFTIRELYYKIFRMHIFGGQSEEQNCKADFRGLT